MRIFLPLSVCVPYECAHVCLGTGTESELVSLLCFLSSIRYKMTDNRRPGSGQRPSQQPESNNATIPAPDQRPNTALSINTATAIQQRTTGYQPSPTSQNITSRIPGASPAAYEPTSTVASAPVLNAQNRLHPNPFPSALPSANSQRPPKTAITMMSASAVSSTQPRHHLSSIRATPTGLTSDSNRSRLVRLERTRTVHGIRQLEYAGLVPPGMLHRADRMMSRNGQCQRFWAIVAQVTTFWYVIYLEFSDYVCVCAGRVDLFGV
jgi:hypothetical protein